MFDVEAYERLHAEGHLGLGKPLVYTAQTGSTNDEALRAAKLGAPHGATFVADHQTHGRGRRGRQWLDEAGSSLLASVLLRTALPNEAVSIVALAAGLSVRSAVERALHAESDPRAPGANRVQVKWPNDVWLDGKKIAGVLCESQIVSGRIEAIVVGFGINAGSASFPDELQSRATSLLRAGVAVWARETLLIDALSALETRIRLLFESGSSTLVEELTHYDALLGREVSVDGLRGTAMGIDTGGHLKLRGADGSTHALNVGTVELL